MEFIDYDHTLIFGVLKICIILQHNNIHDTLYLSHCISFIFVKNIFGLHKFSPKSSLNTELFT